jgi:pre-rRNA-processing protein IPI3
VSLSLQKNRQALLRQATTHESVTAYSRQELLRDWEHFAVHPPDGPAVENDAVVAAARLDGRRTSELEDEVARLKSQLARAKGINDVMWETLMQNVPAQGKDMMAASEPIPDSHEDTAGRARKRGRTKA